MDLIRLRTMLAPAFAGLFVILLVCFVMVRRPTTGGVWIHLYPLHPKSNPSGVCNYREIVLWLTKDGKMWMNDYQVPSGGLRAKLAEVFGNRMIKKVYVVADSEVSYEQFVDFMSKIVGASPDLHVILLSGQLRQEVESGPTFENLCVLESPESGSPWVHPAYLP
jgi:biopolymer transport protein ExbD